MLEAKDNMHTRKKAAMPPALDLQLVLMFWRILAQVYYNF